MNQIPEIWLFTGIPGAGKSTVARAFAERHKRAAFVEGDALRRFVVSGVAWPEGAALEGEAERQYELAIRNQCLLARSFWEAGFLPVLDGVVVTRHHLDAYRNFLAGGRLYLVVLAPVVAVAARRNEQRPGKTAPDFSRLDGVARDELGGAGLWVDSSELTVDETVATVVEGREQALLH
ncbi:MAG: AAA family ATPase [Dehalococcoidia bacterium]|jgi:adenylylsulfate kinase-like enzyme|nr:AAA family ATPase [Dehalococcoidia bacterium]